MLLSPLSQIARIEHFDRIILQTDTESFCGLTEGFSASILERRVDVSAKHQPVFSTGP